MGEKCALCVHFANIIFFKYTCNLVFLGQKDRLLHKTRPKLSKRLLKLSFPDLDTCTFPLSTFLNK